MKYSSSENTFPNLLKPFGKGLWKADGTPQKRFVYIFLNSKDRVLFPSEYDKGNVCSWVNLAPLPPGKGKLKLVLGGYQSSVNRNHRFNVEFQSGAYNYYSTNQISSPIAEIVPYINNTQPNQKFFNLNQSEPIEIEADAKDLQTITLKFQFNIPLINPNRPLLDDPNRIQFLFKFEYD